MCDLKDLQIVNQIVGQFVFDLLDDDACVARGISRRRGCGRWSRRRCGGIYKDNVLKSNL